MNNQIKKLSLFVFLIGITLSISGSIQTKNGIVKNANALIATLSSDQKTLAMMSFEDKDRTTWTFLPAQNRTGLPFKKMSADQKGLVYAFLGAHLSEMGLKKTQSVIALEAILFEMEKDPKRDTEKYFISFFGTPSKDKAWAWSFEGHHVSLNYTIVNGKISSSPQFLGSNPGEVRTGSKKGMRVLKSEEDFAYELLETFNENQKSAAVISDKTYGEIVTRFESEVRNLGEDGVKVSSFNTAQKEILIKLLDVYIFFINDNLAAKRKEQIKANGLENLVFAWAGSTDKGDAHYYRIQGKEFLVEFDNSQNNANHIHSAWRDFNGDFGRDLLKEHYKNSSH
ncbi:MAG: DUF3500 domain-containing protein [Cyclobacteriaceae bacterium]|nr:DUF3500 domain-containing protein [Cyclobacteriaceae bacterium]